MYREGETVVHNHQVCEVAAVRKEYADGADYYELRTVFGSPMTIFVRADEAGESSIRPVMSKDEALALIDSMAGMAAIKPEGPQDKSTKPYVLEKRVQEEFDRRLKSGDPKDLVPIIKTTFEHSREREKANKQATSVDRRYFAKAEGYLYDELSAAIGVPRDEIEDFVLARIESGQGAQDGEGAQPWE